MKNRLGTRHSYSDFVSQTGGGIAVYKGRTRGGWAIPKFFTSLIKQAGRKVLPFLAKKGMAKVDKILKKKPALRKLVNQAKVQVHELTRENPQKGGLKILRTRKKGGIKSRKGKKKNNDIFS